MRVKICGITSERDLRVAAGAGADAVGVIADVTVDTPREVSVERAADLVATAPPLVSTVLVTMAPTTGRIRDLVERVRPDAVQVHTELEPRQLVRLATTVDADVLAVADASDPQEARRYAGVADGILVDSVSASGGGGTGRTHDWTRTAETVRSLSTPVVLAGGLTPENVAEAVRVVDPYGVDVASGVERPGIDDGEPTLDGRKDPTAVRQFVARAREAASENELARTAGEPEEVEQ